MQGIYISGSHIPGVYIQSASAAPVNTVAPVVTGVGYAGQTMSTTNGTWTGSPTGYSYQWQANGVDIFGATSSTYVVTIDKEGAEIRCVVTATNAGGSTDANSNAVHNWIPSDDTSLHAHWDAANESTITASGDEVSSIADQGPNGYDLTVNANYVYTGTRDENGLNVLDFDGDGYMQSTDFQMPADGDVAIISVQIIDEVTLSLDALHAWQSSNDYQINSGNSSFFEGQAAVAFGDSFDFSGSPHSGVGLWNYVTDYQGSSTHFMRKNGASVGSAAMNTQMSQTGSYFVLMTNRNRSGNLNGAVAIMVMTTDNSQANYQKHEGYAAWRYSLVSDLDSGHPYKSSPPTV